MGWDTTITAEYRKKERVFDIKIRGEHYKTSSSDIILGVNEEHVYSPGTRVYRAYHENDMEKREPLVIKDYWPLDFRDTEDLLRDKLLSDISDVAERELVEKHTLTPIASERVMIRDCEDHTKHTILRGEYPTSAYKVVLPEQDPGHMGFFLLQGPDAWTDRIEEPNPDTDSESERRRAYGYRYHYRIVYKEVATPLLELRNIKDILLVIKHSVKGESTSRLLLAI